MHLQLKQLDYRYPQGPTVLQAIDAQARTGELIAIIGPNGAGKSTLLDVLAGHRQPTGGAYCLDAQPVAQLSRAELCRKVAHVPQHIPRDIPFTVQEVVLTGRIPHSTGWYESPADLAALESALGTAQLSALRHRPFLALSGGEQQRVLLAAALCQQPAALLLDEPGAHLDPEHQTSLWRLLDQLRNNGHLVILVTHHLSLAAQWANRVWLLQKGCLLDDGPPATVMTPACLEAVFHVPFFRHDHTDGRIWLSYGR